MKVLYLIDQNVEEGKTSGIITKVKGQISQWKDHGVEVELLSLYEFRLYDCNLNLIDDSKQFIIKKHGRYYTLIRMFLSTLKLFLFLRGTRKYNLIYTRQRPWMPLLSAILKKHKTIIEINTFDESEYKVISNLMYKVNHYTRGWFYPHAIGFVGVTKELAAGYKEEFNKLSVAICNGIFVDDYEVNYPKNDKPKVCFIGAPGFKWHGLEKFELIAKSNLDFDFHIIGIDGENSDNLFYHGYMKLDKAKELVGNCDVGVSTLSLYINNLNESSPLKSRQYMAQGIPMVYGYEDIDLKGNEEFHLKIPNTENNVEQNLENIRNFIVKAHGNESMRKSVRAQAENVLDTKVKEGKRIDFFRYTLSKYQ